MELTFVSYNGTWPTLCAGTLVLAIDGEKVEFPYRCLSSGGSIETEKDSDMMYATEGPWKIVNWPENFPEELKGEAQTLVNDNIPWGCCGGCI